MTKDNEGQKVKKCPKDLMEILASIEHERWSSWMKYQFKQGRFTEKKCGEWTMPADRVARWQNLMNTPYSELTEELKEMDRVEVRKTWKAIQKMILETRIEEREKLMPFIVSSDGGKLGLAELKRQLEEIK